MGGSDRDNFFRLREWQRLEQDGVDHAENGGVRADPEGEGDDGDDSKAWILPELSQGEAEIVSHTLFSAESDDWVHSTGAPSREPGGQERD